jgi:hypothetical protein
MLALDEVITNLIQKEVIMNKNWTKKEIKRYPSDDTFYFERSDGAVVGYNQGVDARVWDAKHRGWIAYLPEGADHRYLGFYRRGGRFYIPRRFATPETAMDALDKEFPVTPHKRGNMDSSDIRGDNR